MSFPPSCIDVVSYSHYKRAPTPTGDKSVWLRHFPVSCCLVGFYSSTHSFHPHVWKQKCVPTIARSSPSSFTPLSWVDVCPFNPIYRTTPHPTPPHPSPPPPRTTWFTSSSHAEVVESHSEIANTSADKLFITARYNSIEAPNRMTTSVQLWTPVLHYLPWGRRKHSSRHARDFFYFSIIWFQFELTQSDTYKCHS